MATYNCTPLPFILNTHTGLYSMPVPLNAQDIIHGAKHLLHRQLSHGEDVRENPEAIKNYLGLYMSQMPDVNYALVLLSPRYRLMGIEPLPDCNMQILSPTLRRSLQTTLSYQAAHVMLACHHIDGETAPSSEDFWLIHTLQELLAYIDVSLVESFVVTGMRVISLNEQSSLHN